MAVDRKKLLAELKKVKERMGKIRYLKANSVTHLRVLEFQDEEGSIIFARSLVEHKKAEEGFQGKGKVCRLQTFGEQCAYCQIDTLAKESGETSPYRFRNTYLVSAIDIDSLDKKVTVWSLPTTVYNAIAALLLDDDYADLLEAKSGCGLTIKKEGSGLDTTYTTMPMRNPWPVSPSLLKQVKDPLEVVDDPGLEAQLDELGMDKESLFEDADDLGEIEEKAPKKKGRPKKVVDEDGEPEPTEESVEEAEPSEEPEEAEPETEEESTNEPACFGESDLFEEDDEEGCQTCPWFDKCKKKVFKKKAATKTVAKTKVKRVKEEPVEEEQEEAPKVKGKRGRPKGSSNVKSVPEKKSTKSMASRILGK